MLLPSSNWFSPKVAAGNSKVFIYGSRNNVVVLTILPRQYLGSFTGHLDKVTAVGLSHSILGEKQDNPTAVSASVDGKLFCWEIATFTVVASTAAHAEKSPGKEVTSLAISEATNRIVSVDRAGLIVCWDRITGQTKSFQPLPKPITDVTYASATTFAVGYLNGHISVMDDRSGDIVHSLVGHVDEIQNLAGFSSTLSAPSLLLSACKDRTLKVWDCETGEQKLSVMLPRTQDDSSKSKIRKFASISWGDNSGIFYSSNVNGDLLEWDLSTRKFAKLASLHNRPIFSITHLPGLSTFVTTSMDRKVVSYNYKKKEVVWKFNALAGFVYALSLQAADPRKLGVAVGDSTIRIWNLQSSKDPGDSVVLWKGLQGKITAIAWHPEDSSLIAYGNEEGTVGVYDVYQQKPKIHASVHNGQIYKLQWAKQGDELYLYSCGKDGKIFALVDGGGEKGDLSASLQSALADPKTKFSDFSFASDPSFLAVSLPTGLLAVFENLQLKWKIHEHRQVVNSVEWGVHPETKLCFATASGDTTARVYRPSADGWSGTILRGHEKDVNRVIWSPHDPDVLATCSSDSTAQIWSCSGTPLKNVRIQAGRLFGLAWSQFDANLLYFGGDDQTVTAANWSLSPHVGPPGEAKEKQAPRKEKKPVKKPTPPRVETAEVQAKKKNRPLLPSLEQLSRSEAVSLVETQLCEGKFPLPSGEVELDRAILAGDSSKALGLSLQCNKLSTTLEQAERLGMLSSSLVAASAACGRVCWRNTVLAFSKQLASQGKYVKSSNYLMMIDKVEEAVKVLSEHDLYLEAISLAAAQHLPDSQLSTLYNQWAISLEKKPKYELSAACYINSGSPGEAIRVLKHRADSQSLLLASKVAKTFHFEDSESLLISASSHAAGEANFPFALECLKNSEQTPALSGARCVLEVEIALNKLAPFTLSYLSAPVQALLDSFPTLSPLLEQPSSLTAFVDSILSVWLEIGIPRREDFPIGWPTRRLNDFAGQVSLAIAQGLLELAEGHLTGFLAQWCQALHICTEKRLNIQLSALAFLLPSFPLVPSLWPVPAELIASLNAFYLTAMLRSVTESQLDHQAIEGSLNIFEFIAFPPDRLAYLGLQAPIPGVPVQENKFQLYPYPSYELVQSLLQAVRSLVKK